MGTTNAVTECPDGFSTNEQPGFFNLAAYFVDFVREDESQCLGHARTATRP
jgi:hypothetical protein